MVVNSYHPLRETRVEREALVLIDKGIAVDVICLRNHRDEVSEKVKGVQVFRPPVQKHKEHEGLVHLLEFYLFFVYSSIFLTWQSILKQYKVTRVLNLPDYSDRNFISNPFIWETK